MDNLNLRNTLDEICLTLTRARGLLQCAFELLDEAPNKNDTPQEEKLKAIVFARRVNMLDAILCAVWDSISNAQITAQTAAQ